MLTSLTETLCLWCHVAVTLWSSIARVSSRQCEAALREVRHCWKYSWWWRHCLLHTRVWVHRCDWAHKNDDQKFLLRVKIGRSSCLLSHTSGRMLLQGPAAEVVNAVFVQQTMKTASSDEDLAFKQCLGMVETPAGSRNRSFPSQGPKVHIVKAVKACERSKQELVYNIHVDHVCEGQTP